VENIAVNHILNNKTKIGPLVYYRGS